MGQRAGAGLALRAWEVVMRGTAVLVHGMWSSPADWRWVAERLRDNDVQVVIPDLPSHRTGSAGLTAAAPGVRPLRAGGADETGSTGAGRGRRPSRLWCPSPPPRPGIRAFSRRLDPSREEDPHIL